MAAQQRQSGPPTFGEEISLLDLSLILVRRRRVVAGAAALCLLAGLAVALSTKQRFAYRATMEIGSVVAGTGTRAIDNPENVLSKVRESYIPLVLHRYAKEQGEELVYAIRPSLPAKSEIVVLEGQGNEAEGPVYLELLRRITEILSKDHRRIVASLVKEIEIKQNIVRNELAALQDDRRILLADKKRLETMASLLEGQIEEMRQSLARAEQHRGAARAEARDEAAVMTLLILDQESREARVELSELQERLHIEISGQRDKVGVALSDNERQQAEKRDMLSKLQLDQANFRETRVVVEPMRSLKPVGTSKSVIVLLSLVVGSMVGVFAAFFAEFYSKVRAATEQRKQFTQGA